MYDQLQACLQQIQEVVNNPAPLETAEDLERLEKEYARQCDSLFASMIGIANQSALDSADMREKGRELTRSAPKKLKAAEVRPRSVQFQRGPPVYVDSKYYRRRKGDIQHRGKGLFPELVLLGMHEHISPGASSNTACVACAMCSLEEAAAWLRDTGGLDLNEKTIRRITRCFGERARAALSEHLRIATADIPCEDEKRTLVISVDGGRLRIRRNKRGLVVTACFLFHLLYPPLSPFVMAVDLPKMRCRNQA